MLDGLGGVQSANGNIGYVERAAKLGMPALALTDHGTVMGAPVFYKECRANDIEPILGEEFYFHPNADKAKDEKNQERFHITVLAKNAHGFRTLCEWSTEANAHFYGKPILDRAIIEATPKADRKNIVILSGCAGSILARKILGEAIDDELSVRDELEWWRKQSGIFRIELMHHDTAFDMKLNTKLLKLARKHDLRWVITNDPHYVHKKEAAHHDALLAIQTGSDVDDPNRFRFDGSGYHLRSRSEIKRAFAEYGSSVWKPGIAESVSLAKKCHTRIPEWETRSWHIPSAPGVDDADAELRKRALRGLRRRGLDGDERYVKRMKKELKALTKVGMSDFLLITSMANEFAKSRGIPIGPGRGSIAGCLVGYLIDIHKVDSVKYDLLFERFLNPERPKMPDVDMDYGQERRDEVFDFYKETFGEENIIPVGAYQTMQIKRAFHSLAKAYGISDYRQRQDLADAIKVDAEGEAILPPEIIEGFPELTEQLDRFIGVKSAMSSHAAGLVVLDPKDSIRDYVPRLWIPPRQGVPGRWVCQYNLESVTLLGLLKQDALALRTLDTIAETVKMVSERHGVEMDVDSWVPDDEEHDKAIYKMLTKGDCHGIFQLEGGTMFDGIQKIAPTCFDDIVITTALYRKGPMMAGAPDRFLKNRREGKVRVLHPSLKPYLKATWGELIYQEQMFAILNEVAGLSWSRVDDAKSAMSLKDPVKMAGIKADAVAGFRKVAGMDESTADAVWEMIAAQSAYLFNKSHAVAYSLVTYQTARLKYLYRLEFLTALMRTVKGKSPAEKEKRRTYLGDAIRGNIRIMPPDVNLSDHGFVCDGTNKLLFGLIDIKGVGDKAVDKIIRGRPRKGYKSLTQLQEAVNNEGVIKALSECGALACLGVDTPDPQVQEDRLEWVFQDRVAPFREKYDGKMKRPRTNNGQVKIWCEIIKTEKKQTKSGNDYVSWVVRCAPGEEYRVQLWSDADELWPYKKGTLIRLTGRWNEQFRSIAVNDPGQVRKLKPMPLSA
jgi:DNA polymerase-3 subunit alpha